MSFIWQEQYSLGIPEIDDQHQQFFRITNRIWEMVEKKKATNDELQIEASELADYAFYHFATEEKYLGEYDCPMAAEHVKLHDAFRVKIKENLAAIRKLDVDVPAAVLELADFSATWLTHHILEADRQYVPCFKSGGNKVPDYPLNN